MVVIDEAKDALPAARALLSGGIDVMEITFRTSAAAEAIKSVSEGCPDMLVGAGTVVTEEQCKRAVEMGAKFIVSPGFDESVTRWCIENGIPVVPGCVTPTEITKALSLGLSVLKFFPANVYGGLSAMKALSAPFPNVKFIPTGGINGKNVAEYISAPFIHAVGGSWICSRSDINGGRFERITQLTRESRHELLGFKVAHIGINCQDSDGSMALCKKLENCFDFAIKEGNSSNFSSSSIEVMKTTGKGEMGHIAVRTNSIGIAAAELEKRGFQLDMETAKYKDGRMIAVYLKEDFGGFAVHLLQNTGE